MRTLADCWTLTKPEVNLLIAIAVFASFCLARPATWQSFPYALLIHTLLGTLFVANGTGVLNQVTEQGCHKPSIVGLPWLSSERMHSTNSREW